VLLTSHTPRIAVTLLLHFVIVITNKRKAASVTNELSIPSEIRYNYPQESILIRKLELSDNKSDQLNIDLHLIT
jgi:hypothetical protein